MFCCCFWCLFFIILFFNKFFWYLVFLVFNSWNLRFIVYISISIYICTFRSQTCENFIYSCIFCLLFAWWKNMENNNNVPFPSAAAGAAAAVFASFFQSIHWRCSYLLFCYFNGMPLNNFIKCFVRATNSVSTKNKRDSLKICSIDCLFGFISHFLTVSLAANKKWNCINSKFTLGINVEWASRKETMV